LTELEARREAARLARQAFEARTDLRSPDGMRVLPTFDPARFQGGLVKGRWTFELAPPSGAAAQVSFDRAGGHPEVKISYSDE
jgi:hypothetical protein